MVWNAHTGKLRIPHPTRVGWRKAPVFHNFLNVQPGAVKLVLWRHWVHLSFMPPVRDIRVPIPLHQAVEFATHAQTHIPTCTYVRTHTRCVRRVEICVRANCHVGQGRSRCECVGTRVNEHEGVARNFSFVFTLPVYVRVCLSSRLSWRLFWNARQSWRSFRSIRQSASFSGLLLSDLLSSLYWPWDPLSSLESTPVSI